MKKTFRIEDLCCANCAARMEDAMRKLPGVHSVNVAFLAQKVVLEAEDDRFDDIAAECAKICRKIEPDCELILK